jgi:hypothetical protein
MVFYYTPRGQGHVVYMGKDKFENEHLIEHAWPEDVWFHVSEMSSAHVYVRMPKGGRWDDIPADVVDDCAQLVKANSIQGMFRHGPSMRRLICARKQAQQHHRHLHPRVEFKKNRRHGRWRR